MFTDSYISRLTDFDDGDASSTGCYALLSTPVVIRLCASSK